MEAQKTTTLSFYRYARIEDPAALMEELRAAWLPLGVLGRTYLAGEGINAQISVPSENLEAFQEQVRSVFPGIPFKIALEEPSDSFLKLTIKVRKKLVADGLEDVSGFDSSQVGRHLDAEAFHAAIDRGSIVVDMRNHYECEVGRFENALVPEANTFREALPEMLEKLKGQEDKTLLLYCTGGIRCEKASAWFKFHGFRDVNQLHGGIIDYARQVNENNLKGRFVGKNFVFDKRMGERVSDEIIARCHQCGEPNDDHTNCGFDGCNRLFIQCPRCSAAYGGCCSETCLEIVQMPREDQVRIQKEWEEKAGPKYYRSRTRPLPVKTQENAESGDYLL